MRTKFKSKAKDCGHPANAREWETMDLLRVLKCTSCKIELRRIPTCVKCHRDMVPDGERKSSYGGKCIFVKCPKECQIPILWNKNAYYGLMAKEHEGREKVVRRFPELQKPSQLELDCSARDKTPIFAWTDDGEKPSHRWHYGRQEWVKLERRNK